MLADSITSRIADAALGVAYADLPNAVTDKAGQLIADMLLVAAAGKSQPSSVAMGYAVVPSLGKSTVWFARLAQTWSALDATFLNTLHAGALDFDSLNGAVHADLVTLPAAWAIAEEYDRSPRELLTAYVVASETVSRLSRCSSGASRGWSGTSIYGGIGAALASGLLMGLDASQLTHALGLAAIQAAGTQQANVEQTLAKRLQPAFAARNGVFAAKLAQAGATAPRQALEGKFGLRALYQPGDDALVFDGWRTEWQILDTCIKRFPVCACSHGAIQALLDITEQTLVDPDDVTEVVATISPFMSRLIGGEFSVQGDLEVVAQFNLRYHLALILLRGSITLAALAPDAVRDPAVGDLVRRIHLVVDSENPNELAPASISLRLKDGRSFDATCHALPGSPEAPLSRLQWQEKLKACGEYAQPAVSNRVLRHLLSALDGFSAVTDLRSIWDEI
jgi:2-methylcitrate dehydratase PrpD